MDITMKNIVGFFLLEVVSRLAVAQMWGPQQNFFRPQNSWGSLTGTNGLNNLWGGQNNNVRYFTCIGKNINQDEMRLTFTENNQQNQLPFWQRSFGRSNNNNVKLEASILVSGQSQTQGQFTLIVTENGRVEDGCYPAALGRIVNNFNNINNWFMRRPNNAETGIIGQPFMLAPNNGQQWTGDLDGFNSLEDLNGHGVALCHSQFLNNGMCNQMMPLCCKIGYDSQPATRAINGNLNQFGGVMGQGVGGMNTGLNTGLNSGGFNGGFNGGLNTGLNSGLNNGLNTGLNSGLNTGLGIQG